MTSRTKGLQGSRRWLRTRAFGLHVATVALLAACVTINVYFPAAEAQEAAKQFVEKVIGDQGQPAQPAPEAPKPDTPKPESKNPGGMAVEFHFDPLMLVGIGQASAQEPDFKLNSPAIQAIESRIDGRFDSNLRDGFQAGALGFSNDGLVVVRDASKLGLKDRVATNAAVADDNRDRKALYREAAVANGHPEWEAQIRKVFAKQWIAAARPGWWYQDASGGWKQK
jgi:uncharacterized protein YdbL (DUF1318 family)